METFQMSQTRAYKTGGTIHLVINNQVGFTTSRQDDARSTEYATDVAKMIQAPIFHVNGDDPEAVLFVTQLAVDYRMQFKRDVVIDLVCCRRRGHNEADEPSGTQPLMYQQIAKQRTTRELYADALVNAGVLSAEQVQSKIDDYRDALDSSLHVVKEPGQRSPTGNCSSTGVRTWAMPGPRHDTRFDLKTLQELSARCWKCRKASWFSAGFRRSTKIARRWRPVACRSTGGFAETLAYATLLFEGHRYG